MQERGRRGRELFAFHAVDYKVDIANAIQTSYSFRMIRSKTLRSAARILLGAFIAAYAMVSMHVYAKAPPSVPEAAHEMAVVVESNLEKHCQEHLEQQPDPALLLCKFHCLSEIQTLDHPDASVHALPDAAVLLVPVTDPAIARKPLVDKALRANSTHHSGSPPLYSSTSRLRV